MSEQDQEQTKPNPPAALAKKGSKNQPVSFGKPQPEEITRDPVMRFLIASEPTKKAPASDPDNYLFVECPIVWAFLTEPTLPDGRPRTLSTLLLFYEDNVWKSCLNDRHNQRALWRAGPTPLSAIVALEDEIKEELPAWRKSAPWKPAQGRR